MFFGKKDNLIGLDIGSKTIKVAEVKFTKKGKLLKKFGVADVPHGAIEDGNIKDADALSEVIHDLIKKNKIKEQNVAVSIGGYSVIVKTINVPTMTEEQLHETIHFEAEQYIPFDIADVNLDFQILGESQSDSNKMSVLLVAAKKDLIEDYTNLIENSGLNPCIIDVDIFALQNIYEHAYFDILEPVSEDKCTGLIDVGASKASLNILRGDKSLFMRDFSVGCSQIDEQLISQLDCSAEEAEEIKINRGSDKISQDEYKLIESTIISGWCNEIGRALDFFFSSHSEFQVNNFLISGGGNYIKDFSQLLAQQTSSSVNIINPFEGLSIDSSLDNNFLENIATQASICMGLALRRVNDK